MLLTWVRKNKNMDREQWNSLSNNKAQTNGQNIHRLNKDVNHDFLYKHMYFNDNYIHNMWTGMNILCTVWTYMYLHFHWLLIHKSSRADFYIKPKDQSHGRQRSFMRYSWLLVYITISNHLSIIWTCYSKQLSLFHTANKKTHFQQMFLT